MTRTCAVMFSGCQCRCLPPYLGAIKSLCQLKPLPFGEFLVSLPEHVIPLARKMTNLTVVAAQGCHLYIEGIGNIAEVIRLLSTPEEDFFDFVRLETLFNQVRICPTVSGIGKNSVQHSLTGYAVVAMPDIPSIRVASSYDFWSMGSD